MLYLYNNEYYIKRMRTLIQVIPSLDKIGNVILVPTDKKLRCDECDYSMISLDEVKKRLSNVVEEKTEVEKKSVEVENKPIEVVSYRKYSGDIKKYRNKR